MSGSTEVGTRKWPSILSLRNLIFFILCCVVGYVISFIAYNSYCDSGACDVYSKTVDALFTLNDDPPSAENLSETFGLTIVYPSSIPPAGSHLSSDPPILLLTIWKPLELETLSDAPLSSTSDDCPSAPPVKALDSGPRLLIWSPSHAIWFGTDVSEEPRDEFVWLDLQSDLQSITSTTNLIRIARTPVASSGKTGNGDTEVNPNQVDICVYFFSEGDKKPSTFYSFPPTLESVSTLELKVSVQKYWAAGRNQALHMIFGGAFDERCLTIPAFFSLLGIGAQLYEFSRKRRDEHLQSLRQRVEEVKKDPSIHWEELWTLRNQMNAEREADALKEQLDAYIRREAQHGPAPWFYEMRSWLGKELDKRSKQSEEAEPLNGRKVNRRKGHYRLIVSWLSKKHNRELGSKERLKLLQKLEGLDLLNGYQAEDVEKRWKAVSLLSEGKPPDAKQVVELVELLGLEAAQEIVNRLNEVETRDALINELAKDSSPIALYLLYKLGEADRAREYYRASYDNLRGPCRVWRKIHIVDEHNPFGPLKAEDDPRLARKKGQLFWPLHPQWKQISEPGLGEGKDGLFLFPPGGGLSAFLLRARYEHAPYSLWPSLSVYLFLEHPVSNETWLHSLHTALAESLLCALVADPVWLLIAPSREVISFIQHYLQEHQIKFDDALRLRGMDVQHGAGRLLMELFTSKSTEHNLIPLSWALLYAAVDAALRRLTLYVEPLAEKLSLFFWIEVPETEQGFETLKWVAQERHLRDLGIVKLFSRRSNLTDAQMETWDDTFHLPLVEIEWSFEDLLGMAKWRLKQQVEMSNNKKQDIEELKEAFEKHVRGRQLKTPREMMRAGNAWWHARRTRGF